MTSTKRRLIVIVGATASGKSDLAVRLARHYSAPIISTDSRQIFRGIPIGTAQPTAEQLAAVEHHFIAERGVDEPYSCGEYEREAIERLNKLFAKCDTVVAVGGSGLYIQALCEGIDDLPEIDETLRATLNRRLAEEGLESLVEELQRLDKDYYEEVDRSNPQRILRALEVCISSGRPYSEQRVGSRKQRDFQIVKVGIAMEREQLYDRINRRVDAMFDEGLVEEARAMYPQRDCNALHTVGFSELFDHFAGLITLEEARELIKRNTRRYAKRQMTWFRRDAEIGWFEAAEFDKIVEYIESQFG